MRSKQQFLQFEETGYLSAGVHACTWSHFQKLTFTNGHRQQLGSNLLRFLKWPVKTGNFPRMYVGGGFVSDRPFPQDIDLVLETQYPFGPEAFAALEPFFSKGIEKILKEFSVHLHFRMEDAPSGFADYRSFFQYQKPQWLDSFNSLRKGIIRLSMVSDEFAEFLEESSRAVGKENSTIMVCKGEMPQTVAA